MQKLIEEFFKSKETILKDLENLKEQVNNEFPLSEATLASLLENSKKIRENYNELKEISTPYCEEEELLTPLSFGKYVDIIHNSAILKWKNEKDRISIILSDFSSLKSNSPNLLELIEMYIIKADVLLEELPIKKVAEDMTEEELELIQSCEIFFEGLNVLDLSDDSSEEIFDKLDELFNKKISRGVAAKQYYVDKNETLPLKKDETVVKHTTSTPTPIEEEPTSIVEEPTPVDEETASIDEETAPIVEEPTLVEEEPIPIVEESTTEELGPFLTILNNVEPKKNDVKNFMKNTNDDISRFLIPLLYNLFNLITVEQCEQLLMKTKLCVFNDKFDTENSDEESENSIFHNTLLKLEKLGILCTYQEEGLPVLYGLTDSTIKLLQKEKVYSNVLDITKPKKRISFIPWLINLKKKILSIYYAPYTVEEAIKIYNDTEDFLKLMYEGVDAENYYNFIMFNHYLVHTEFGYTVVIINDTGKEITEIPYLITQNIDVDYPNILLVGDIDIKLEQLDKECSYIRLINYEFYILKDDKWVYIVNPTTNEEEIENTEYTFEEGIKRQTQVNKTEEIETETVETEVEEIETEEVIEEVETEEAIEEIETVEAEETIEEMIEEVEEIEEIEELILDDDINIDFETMSIFDIVSIMRKQQNCPTDDVFLKLINKLLLKQKCVELTENTVHEYHNILNAVLLAYVGSFSEEAILTTDYFEKLKCATNISLDKKISFNDLDFSNDEKTEEVEELASLFFELLIPSESYDHQTRDIAGTKLKEFEENYPNFTMLKSLLNELCEARNQNILEKDGFSTEIISYLHDSNSQQNLLDDLVKRAKDLMVDPNIKASFSGSAKFKKIIFGEGSDFYDCFELFEETDKDSIAFMQKVVDRYCESNQIIDKKIENAIDEYWKEVALEVVKLPKKFDYTPRIMCKKAIIARLELIIERINFKIDLGYGANDYEKVKKIIKKLKLEISNVLPEIAKIDSKFKPAIIYMALQKIALHLDGHFKFEYPFAHLLQTGIIPQNEQGVPYINKEFHDFFGYEPWRCVLKHISLQDYTFEQAIDTVSNSTSKNFDNIYQYEQITRYCPDFEEKTIEKEELDRCYNISEKRTKDACNAIILAFTYDRISENEKDDIIQMISHYHEEFCDLKAFACWNDFLKSLPFNINKLSIKNEIELSNDIEDEKQNAQDQSLELLDEALKIIETTKNLAVAEEYLNRYKLGERSLPQYSNYNSAPNLFEEFISDKVYNTLYNKCKDLKGVTLARFAKEFAEKRNIWYDKKFTENWTKRNYTDGEILLNAWPVRSGNVSPTNIRDIFNHIGFKVDDVKKQVNPQINDCFTIDLKKEALDKESYEHPIASLGTQTKPGMNVIVLFGNRDATQLLREISQVSSSNITFVLLDHYLTLSERRVLVQKFRELKSSHNTFLLIDRVLLLHLILKQGERLNTFLQCTLPFTFYQPFVSGQGASDNEMFFGRSEELAKIIDPKGPVLLYGGRQLGKTALLERALTLCSKPNEKKYALYCTLPKNDGKNKVNEAQVVEELLNACQKNKISFKKCVTIKEFCKQIEEWYDKNKFTTFHIFFDESDHFLDNISEDNYKQIESLVETRRYTKNDFKFVLAGLHDVSRAKRAVEKNGLFGQLGTSLCIKPLKPQEALSLIASPLKYLGFNIDNNEHLQTILTNTNYYPGILQLFGYTLVMGLSKEYSNHYSPANGNPPFTLNEEQLGEIMNSQDLLTSIKDKFELSLKLDIRYQMLSRCVAYLYYLNGGKDAKINGFSVKQILEIANVFGIKCLENVSEDECANLLTEMEDMGILAKYVDSLYYLRRKSFLEIIGNTEKSIEDAIEKDNV